MEENENHKMVFSIRGVWMGLCAYLIIALLIATIFIFG